MFLLLNFYLFTTKSNFKPNIPCGPTLWKKTQACHERQVKTDLYNTLLDYINLHNIELLGY